MRTTRITITRIESSARKEPDVNEQLQCLARALGLFGQRDKDSSKFRIFIALLRSVRRHGEGMTSDDLAEATKLTRATVIHHLGSLMDAGIVEQNRGRYQMRVESLEELVTKIQGDLNRTLEDLKKLAHVCDEELGL